MTDHTRPTSWRVKLFVYVLVPILGLVGLVSAGSDLGPAWDAKSGKGTAGSFTAVRVQCSRRHCTTYGDFTPTSGGSKRTDVILYDDHDHLGPGERTPALDSGADNGVYSTAGGYSWLVDTLVLVGSALALVVWAAVLAGRLVGRVRSRGPSPVG